MNPADTINPVDNIAKLIWIKQTTDIVLDQRAAAIVGARDDDNREWLVIASAAGLSRQQVVNIYRAAKGLTDPK